MKLSEQADDILRRMDHADINTIFPALRIAVTALKCAPGAVSGKAIKEIRQLFECNESESYENHIIGMANENKDSTDQG